MLKGHTLIELTNENTGKKEVYEHDNMITTAIEKEILSNKGLFNMPINSIPIYYYNGLYKYNNIINLFGGLFLFHDPLSLDKDDYLIPFSNDLTGYGVYNNNNSGANTLLGSFSNVESGLQDDGSYKFVYNFNTAQGNGQISSIALTPMLSGKMSTGIKSEYFSSQQYLDISVDKLRSTNSVSIFTQGVLCHLDENYSYVIDKENFIKSSNEFIGTNGKNLTIRKYSNPIHKININDYSNIITQEYETYTITIPQYTTFNDAISCSVQSDYFYLIFQEQNNQNSFKLHKIDIVNKICTDYDITLPNNSYLHFPIIANQSYLSQNNSILDEYINKNFCVVNDTLYCFVIPSDNRKKIQLCYYNLLTGESQLIENSRINLSGSNTLEEFMSAPYKNADYFYVRLDTYYYVVNCKNKKVTLLNIKNSTGDFLFTQNTFNDCILYTKVNSDTSFSTSKSYLELRFGTPAQFLSTKNNLETPVTKTSSQSMKVTYTLTPA